MKRTAGIPEITPRILKQIRFSVPTGELKEKTI
jgi:hypothetical protein